MRASPVFAWISLASSFSLSLAACGGASSAAPASPEGASPVVSIAAPAGASGTSSASGTSTASDASSPPASPSAAAQADTTKAAPAAELAKVDTEELAALSPGVTAPVAEGGLHLGPSSGPVRPGTGSGGLAELARSTPGTSIGPVVTRGQVSVRIVAGADAAPNAPKVIAAAMTPGFRRCYNAALKSDPNIAGSVAVTFRISSAGEVDGMPATTASAAIPGNLKSCIAARVRIAQFAPPSKTPATVQLSVMLARDP